jgi:hypothetical protein
MKPVRKMGTGRWSGRPDLVSGSTIHQAPSILTKVDPISSAERAEMMVGMLRFAHPTAHNQPAASRV